MKRIQMRWASLLVIVAMMAGIFAPIARAEDTPAVHGIDRNDMNLGVEPGVDFYDFSNGGWLAETELPPTNPSYGVFNELDDQVTELLLGILADLKPEEGTDSGRVANPFSLGDRHRDASNAGRRAAAALARQHRRDQDD